MWCRWMQPWARCGATKPLWQFTPKLVSIHFASSIWDCRLPIQEGRDVTCQCGYTHAALGHHHIGWSRTVFKPPGDVGNSWCHRCWGCPMAEFLHKILWDSPSHKPTWLDVEGIYGSLPGSSCGCSEYDIKPWVQKPIQLCTLPRVQGWGMPLDGLNVWGLGMGPCGLSSTYLCNIHDLQHLQDIIREDPNTHGSMMVPLLLGSDKTLASNATGQNEFYPLYFSPGNVKNSVRCAYHDTLVPIGFLAIPKSIFSTLWCLICSHRISGTRKDGTSALFQLFQRQLLHESLKVILSPLKPFMTRPDVMKCSDSHYWKAIYALGPYIADYPEQVLLAAVVSRWCTRYVNFHTWKPLILKSSSAQLHVTCKRSWPARCSLMITNTYKCVQGCIWLEEALGNLWNC